MRTAAQILDQQFLEMRWRCLSLAADLDRIDRAAGGKAPARDDQRLDKLRRALQILLTDTPDRAERVQMLFSDMTPAPLKDDTQDTASELAG